jgi:DNA-binding MarR family transcriptional regulator
MDHPSGHVSTPAEAAFTRLVLLVFRLNGMLLEAGDRMAAPVGQTSARWQVMGVIDHGPLTVSQVAREMGLRRQSVQRSADLLAADGMAEYVDNPADKRAKLLALTRAGRRALRTIERAQFEWARNHGEAIGRKSLESAADTLEAITAQLSGRRSER